MSIRFHRFYQQLSIKHWKSTWYLQFFRLLSKLCHCIRFTSQKRKVHQVSQEDNLISGSIIADDKKWWGSLWRSHLSALRRRLHRCSRLFSQGGWCKKAAPCYLGRRLIRDNWRAFPLGIVVAPFSSHFEIQGNEAARSPQRRCQLGRTQRSYSWWYQ